MENKSRKRQSAPRQIFKNGANQKHVPKQRNASAPLDYNEMTAAEINAIIDEAIKNTKPDYHIEGNKFFKPRLNSINDLHPDESKVSSGIMVYIAEFFYAVYDYIREKIELLKQKLFPRKNIIYGTTQGILAWGKLTFGSKEDNNVPLHHMNLEIWARTWWLQWRKLAEGVSDQNGEFALTFDKKAARKFSNMFIHFEIHQTTNIFHENKGTTMVPDYHPQFVYKLFKKIKIKKSKLKGDAYPMGTIPLFYWEYRDDSNVPRVVIKDHDKDSPQSYAHGRTDAMTEQFLPIEFIKRKHMARLRKDPESLTVQEIQADYPMNLTVYIEEKMPGYTRTDKWFGERMMNGMNRGYFQQDASVDNHFWIRYFGACNYKVNNKYAFPDVEVKFELTDIGYPLPVEIQLTGPLNAMENDLWKKRVFTPADQERWEYAKRIARVNGGLCTEVEEHFAGTHLATERFAIAAYRNLRLNPIAKILLPHLKSVILINHTADTALIKEYIPASSALTEEGLRNRCRDILGVIDWNGWKPMTPISEVHTYAKAEQKFWAILDDFLDYYIDKYKEDIKKYWLEIYKFSEDLVNNSVPVFLSDVNLDKMSEKEKEQALKRKAYYSGQFEFDFEKDRKMVNGELKVVSPITETIEFDEHNSSDLDKLKQACKYMIFNATFLHSWVNEKQSEDIGEVLYSCLGLRFGDKPDGVLAPESDMGICPDPEISTKMLWFSNLLSQTEYGFIVVNEEGDVHPYLIEKLNEAKQAFLDLGVFVEDIESRTNI